MTQRLLFVGNFLSGSALNRTYAEELADRFETLGWSVIRTSTRKARLARLADMLHTTWARRHDYDVGHISVFSGDAFVWAEAVAMMLRALGKPYVLSLHGGNLPAFSRRWPHRVRRVLEGAVAVTAPSPYLHGEMRRYRDDIRLINNALDVPTYRFAARVRPQPRLVWLRAFHSVYNPVLAVEVLAGLARKLPDTTLAMIGPDKGDGTLQAVEERARQLHVHDRLLIIRGVPKLEVARYLATGDIFINTTDFDNTPVSVLEAMAAGLCVASTSVGGIPYLLTSEVDALLVPPRNAAAMTDAVQRLVAEPGLGERLSRTAYALVSKMDWPAVLAQWHDLFSRSLGHG